MGANIINTMLEYVSGYIEGLKIEYVEKFDNVEEIYVSVINGEIKDKNFA